MSIGWNFDNSYTNLSELFFCKGNPTPVSSPSLMILNKSLAAEINLNFEQESNDKVAQTLSGNEILAGSEPISQSYAGHQFGYFNKLGDGRAHLLGEHLTKAGKRLDIQLKGSGTTQYARRGDGRAAVGPMLREYVISEAMHALGIPTTRSLAVVQTGEMVMRETVLPGAVLARVADSHIRVGTFEFVSATKDELALKELADYTIERHFPELLKEDQPYLEFLKAVIDRQIDLINNWLRVGFIHGVMNTDNMSICGETIDYGPCAFMDAYNPATVFSSIDSRGRYSYANQPHIAQWNLARLAESLLPLLDDDFDKAKEIANETIESFGSAFQEKWRQMMRRKLGLFGAHGDDLKLTGDILKWMQRHKADYTNTFRDLSSLEKPSGGIYENEEFVAWFVKWQERLALNEDSAEESIRLMHANNPAVIPRNHKVEEALLAASDNGDLQPMQKLLDTLKNPYDGGAAEEFKQAKNTPDYQTFCGT